MLFSRVLYETTDSIWLHKEIRDALADNYYIRVRVYVFNRENFRLFPELEKESEFPIVFTASRERNAVMFHLNPVLNKFLDKNSKYCVYYEIDAYDTIL